MIVGIHGFKGAGKDTVANMLFGALSQDYVMQIHHYARSLKKAAAGLFDVDEYLFYDTMLKEQKIDGIDLSPREIMTQMHDCLVPAFGPNLFVRVAQEKYANFIEHSAHVEKDCLFMVADVRYDVRETDWIREQGGFIIHVHNPNVTAGNHSSEVGIPVKDGDYVVENSGTLEELEKTLEPLIKRLQALRD